MSKLKRMRPPREIFRSLKDLTCQLEGSVIYLGPIVNTLAIQAIALLYVFGDGVAGAEDGRSKPHEDQVQRLGAAWFFKPSYYIHSWLKNSAQELGDTSRVSFAIVVAGGGRIQTIAFVERVTFSADPFSEPPKLAGYTAVYIDQTDAGIVKKIERNVAKSDAHPIITKSWDLIKNASNFTQEHRVMVSSNEEWLIISGGVENGLQVGAAINPPAGGTVQELWSKASKLAGLPENE